MPSWAETEIESELLLTTTATIGQNVICDDALDDGYDGVDGNIRTTDAMYNIMRGVAYDMSRPPEVVSPYGAF